MIPLSPKEPERKGQHSSKHVLGTPNRCKAEWLNTPLGAMLAIADEECLYLLEFANRGNCALKFEKFRKKMKAEIVLGQTSPIQSIKKELDQYFKKALPRFQTPIQMLGSTFQTNVWTKLQTIPMGQTRSYSDIAKALNNPLAVRAIANAIGANPLTLIIPCHRVIHMDGEVGGYSGGRARKKWLLTHEQSK